MSCNCEGGGTPFETSIGNCAPYASRSDVISALQRVDSSCCVGTYGANGDNSLPCSTDANAQAQVAQAFPDGIVACQCPCVFLHNTTTGDLAFNCSGDLSLARNWHCQNHDDCIGSLTTVGLDPSASVVDAATAVSEAWENGYPISCENAFMIREDGTVCTTVDSGVTWDCGTAATVEVPYFKVTAGAGNVGVGLGSGSNVAIPIDATDVDPQFTVAGNTITIGAGVRANSILQINGLFRICAPTADGAGVNIYTLGVNFLIDNQFIGVVARQNVTVNGVPASCHADFGSIALTVQPNDVIDFRAFLPTSGGAAAHYPNLEINVLTNLTGYLIEARP